MHKSGIICASWSDRQTTVIGQKSVHTRLKGGKRRVRATHTGHQELHLVQSRPRRANITARPASARYVGQVVRGFSLHPFWAEKGRGVCPFGTRFWPTPIVKTARITRNKEQSSACFHMYERIQKSLGVHGRDAQRSNPHTECQQCIMLLPGCNRQESYTYQCAQSHTPHSTLSVDNTHCPPTYKHTDNKCSICSR